MIFLALIISFAVVYYTNRNYSVKEPIPCYRVYLKGKSIGLKERMAQGKRP